MAIDQVTKMTWTDQAASRNWNEVIQLGNHTDSPRLQAIAVVTKTEENLYKSKSNCTKPISINFV
jgi:hypothetical protein